MKTLILFRHGKSDWDSTYEADFDRPLARRGRKAARRMGRFLSDIGLVPDSVVASSALRARDTADLAASEGGWRADIRTTPVLYESTPDVVLDLIRAEPGSTNVLLLVGHEPTWSETAGRLIGNGHLRVPTAAMVCITFDLDDWALAGFGSGELAWLITPKMITNS
jgi:phosphohistidine phosphatase